MKKIGSTENPAKQKNWLNRRIVKQKKMVQQKLLDKWKTWLTEKMVIWKNQENKKIS